MPRISGIQSALQRLILTVKRGFDDFVAIRSMSVFGDNRYNIADDIDLDYVLSSILGEFYFTEYVFSGQGPGPIASQLFGLILEIRDFLRAEQQRCGSRS